MRAAEHRTLPVTFDSPPDLDLRKTFAQAGIATLRAGADTLLPATEEVIGGDAALQKRARWDEEPGHGVTAQVGWTSSLWHSLETNLAREAMNSEVGMTRDGDINVNSGGSMDAAVIGMLSSSTSDRLMATQLSGAELIGLSRAAVGDTKLVFTGFDADKMLIDGRPLDEKQSYRTVLVSSLLSDPAFESLLKGKTFEDGPSTGDNDIAGLRALRDENGGLTASYNAALRSRLTSDGPPHPLWLVQLDQIGGVFLANKATDTGDRFAHIREQRLALPDFHTVNARGTVAATYDRAELTWKSDVVFRFNRTYFPSLDGVLPLAQRRLEDQLLPETELRVKTFKLGLGKENYDLVPFLRGRYETEFNHGEIDQPDGTRTLLLRRSYPSGTVGAGLFPGGFLQELRAGFVAQNDFAKTAGRRLQTGFMWGLKLAKGFGVVQAALDSSLTYFPPAGESEPDDLDVIGLSARGTFTLTVPIGGWFRMGLLTDWLGVRGKVPSTDALGQSLQVGATLMLDRAWKPGYQPLFGS